ncbi:hypothetical protein L1987_22940 [Smallanthus sonchifolius]|uniref:Uncharacterized protein n=1 Tax=Smallanthus sonchifolius TaxID=185202 RepID=A0ACB9II00_9ASTR|nr:hypothetical protein L1987_22940 [Smallanthus sonchifolius]
MQGVAVGQAVDLIVLKGYDELIDELELMFEIKGKLRLRNECGGSHYMDNLPEPAYGGYGPMRAYGRIYGSLDFDDVI